MALIEDREVDGVVRLAVEANQALGAAGQGDLVWGHVSVRDPRGRGFWMKASGLGFEEVVASRMLLLGLDGEVLSGTGSRHIEFPIHGEIYRMRPDVECVVHTHSAAANALASLGVPLRALSHEGVLFTHPDVPRFLRTGGLVKTKDLGVGLATTLGDARACLMPRHGLVAVGESVATGVMAAVLLDKACRVQLAAMAAGEPISWSDEAEAASKRDEIWNPPLLESGWQYLRRKALAAEVAAAPAAIETSPSELEWIGENSGRIRTSLPNGYCVRPPDEACPKPDDCVACSHFFTGGRFLPVHRQQARTIDLLIARAEAEGLAAVANSHRRRGDRLKALIRSLEEPTCTATKHPVDRFGDGSHLPGGTHRSAAEKAARRTVDGQQVSTPNGASSSR